MALLTEGKINQFGVTEEYWRVLNINMNIQYNYCDITIGAYANKEARNNNSEPMNIKKVRAKWHETEFLKFFAPKTFQNSEHNTKDVVTNLSLNIYERAYQYIKHKDEYFKDSVDC